MERNGAGRVGEGWEEEEEEEGGGRKAGRRRRRRRRGCRVIRRM